MTNRIPESEEAWDSGVLGRDEEFVAAIDQSQEDDEIIDDAMGLKAISIRLEKSLIEDFKMIAKLRGISYQPLMRQTLKRFADCEKKRILIEAYNKKVAEQDPNKPPDCQKVA